MLEEAEPRIVDRDGNDREPLVKAASFECSKAIDKLAGLIAGLEDRLEIVRFRRGSEQLMDATPPQPGASLLVMELRDHTEAVKRLQRRIGDLLEELEV